MINAEELEDIEETHECKYCGEELDEDQGDFCSRDCYKGYIQDN